MARRNLGVSLTCMSQAGCDIVEGNVKVESYCLKKPKRTLLVSLHATTLYI